DSYRRPDARCREPLIRGDRFTCGAGVSVCGRLLDSLPAPRCVLAANCQVRICGGSSCRKSSRYGFFRVEVAKSLLYLFLLGGQVLRAQWRDGNILIQTFIFLSLILLWSRGGGIFL